MSRGNPRRPAPKTALLHSLLDVLYQSPYYTSGSAPPGTPRVPYTRTGRGICRHRAPTMRSSSARGPIGPLRLPRHPLALARFGRRAMRSARGLAEGVFTDTRARGFFAGLAAHAIMPLDEVPTAAFGLMLGILGHVVGWPFPRGGSQQLA